MPDPRLEPLVLSDDERRILENWARRRRTAQGLALRARIVLACAQGGSNLAVSARLGVNRGTVTRWRARFLDRRLDGLNDEPRPGVPRTITDAQVEAVVVRTLEEVPEGATHWSKRELARQVGISPTSVHRIWRAFGLQPWRTEDFKISPDPLLIDKIRDVAGLYLAPPANAAVFVVDEKPQIQALQRTAPVLPMILGTPERRSHDYVRHGTIDLFAALNTATGKVIGKLSAQHRAVDFRDFLDDIDRQTDPGLAIHVICDNLSAHKAPAVHKWLLAHPASRCISPRPIRHGSARSSGGSPSCSDAAWTAGCSVPSTNSPPRWRAGSRSGMPAPGPSSGPRPPTRSSTASAATAHASPDRDTSRRWVPAARARWWTRVSASAPA
jgi:transposase